MVDQGAQGPGGHRLAVDPDGAGGGRVGQGDVERVGPRGPAPARVCPSTTACSKSWTPAPTRSSITSVAVHRHRPKLAAEGSVVAGGVPGVVLERRFRRTVPAGGPWGSRRPRWDRPGRRRPCRSIRGRPRRHRSGEPRAPRRRGGVPDSPPRRNRDCAGNGPPRPPSGRAMADTSSPADPLSTTMTSEAWGRTDARHSANQEPGRWETTMTDDDNATSACRHDVAVGRAIRPALSTGASPFSISRNPNPRDAGIGAERPGRRRRR